MTIFKRMTVVSVLVLGCGTVSAPGRTLREPGPYVLPCTGVTLTADYLAEALPGRGPGFLFRIENRTGQEIRLEKPVPSSAHWYARVGGQWLWRASAGSGGALVNAEREKGPMFAYRPGQAPQDPEYLTVPAHGAQQWTEAMRDDPAIAYRPSCAECNYPGEREYEAVFAYAYLPNTGEHAADLLRCGLRSAPVPMPPMATRPVRNAGN
jgi:hypothetical protein